MTVLSHSHWLQPLLVLLGIHGLESEMCLHFEHVTNYLLRLTLRDLAEAFTLLRCCLGQTYFRGWLSQFDCLYLTGVLQARCEPRQKVTLVLCVGVCVCACTHVFICICMNIWCRLLANMSAIFSCTDKTPLVLSTIWTQRELMWHLTMLMYFYLPS